MSRARVSTTVDGKLLEQARALHAGTSDSALVEEALLALLAQYRSVDIDATCAAYDTHPLGEPDDWGDLDTFRRTAAAS